MNLRTSAARRPLTRTAVASVAALALLTGIAACGGSKSHSAAAPTLSVPASVSPSASPTVPATSPFTGLPMTGNGGSVLAIKIDNTHPALPHIGLAAADIVYIEQVEGGLTRIAAIYAANKPGVVAPIRSARETDAELLPTFGPIPVAFSGSVAKVHALIVAAGLKDVSQDKGGLGYYRLAGGRFAPYNLAGQPNVLVKRGGAPVHPHFIGLVFGPAPTTGGTSATLVKATFPGAVITFKYQPATQRWVYRLDGRLDQLPGRAPQSASTVVIQYVSIGSAHRGDKLNNTVPFTHTIGSGKGLVARDGKVYPVVWSRPSASAPTTWTYQGAPFPMKAGQPWIIMVNKKTPITFS